MHGHGLFKSECLCLVNSTHIDISLWILHLNVRSTFFYLWSGEYVCRYDQRHGRNASIIGHFLPLLISSPAAKLISILVQYRTQWQQSSVWQCGKARFAIAHNSCTLSYLLGSRVKHNPLFIERSFVGKTRVNKNSKERTQNKLRILT